MFRPALKNRANYFRILNNIKAARDYYPGIMEVTPSDLVNLAFLPEEFLD